MESNRDLIRAAMAVVGARNQAALAALIGVSVSTVADWSREATAVPGPALHLLRLLAAGRVGLADLEAVR